MKKSQYLTSRLNKHTSERRTAGAWDAHCCKTAGIRSLFPEVNGWTVSVSWSDSVCVRGVKVWQVVSLNDHEGFQFSGAEQHRRESSVAAGEWCHFLLSVSHTACVCVWMFFCHYQPFKGENVNVKPSTHPLFTFFSYAALFSLLFC